MAEMDVTQANIERTIRAKENAILMSEFAESIRCDSTVIDGDRYKVRFSDYSERGDS